MARPKFLSQTLLGGKSRLDAQIRAKARIAARSYPKTFSRNVRGLACTLCGSRKTKTEFYRIPPRRAQFGVTCCDDCGAC